MATDYLSKHTYPKLINIKTKENNLVMPGWYCMCCCYCN